MKKQKMYFCDEIDEERAYTIDYFIEEMKDQQLTELKVYEAVRETKTEYFYCKSVMEVCSKSPEGEQCGKECCDYKPRNGKSGICKHWGFCYTSGKAYKLTVDGKLSLIKAERN
jgi:hypothetical protein